MIWIGGDGDSAFYRPRVTIRKDTWCSKPPGEEASVGMSSLTWLDAILL